ncbi:hypothetical protein [Neobacillus niacini]|nr:hypothetical protein [Neobacillus niacini]
MKIRPWEEQQPWERRSRGDRSDGFLKKVDKNKRMPWIHSLV